MEGIIGQLRNILAMVAAGMLLVLLSPAILLYILFNAFVVGGPPARKPVSR